MQATCLAPTAALWLAQGFFLRPQAAKSFYISIAVGARQLPFNSKHLAFAPNYSAFSSNLGAFTYIIERYVYIPSPFNA